MHCQFCGAALESLPTVCPFCGAQPVLGVRYEVRAVIGRGGMGEVLLAYDRRLANEVALKRLTPQLAASPELRESLTKEARIMARLSDSAIVRLFDLGEFDGDLFLVLEYVCGPTLRDMIRAGYRTTPLELAQLMSDLCRGLSVAHASGVIHRDLKPSNLLLSLQGAAHDAYAASRQLPANLSQAKVKITDFGIAKAVADSRLTLTNAFSGTPGYMAPEQFRGEKPSPETDVYALGVLTCELLTGKLPAAPLRTIEGVHPAVTQVVAKAMSPVRANRFPTAAAFYDALVNAIEGRSPVLQAVRPARPASSSQRVAVVALAVVFTVVVLLALSFRNSPSLRSTTLTTTPFEGDHPIDVEWHALPRVTELPPVVEEARGRLPANLAGPRHPKIQWSLTLPVIASAHIVAVGTDGTVYATSMQEICAVREGKLLWGYKLGLTGVSDARFDADGRLWFHSLDSTYCVNRDGKGGRVPKTFTPPPETAAGAPYGCIMNQKLMGPHFELELDGSCSSSGVAVTPDGAIHVADDLPEILSVDRLGKILSKYTPPCNPTALFAWKAGGVMFPCGNNTLHGVSGQSEIWAQQADGTVGTEMLVAPDGTIYYGDFGRESGVTHLHAIDGKGAALWTVDLKRVSMSYMALGGQGRLFMSGSALNSRILCLAD